MIIGPELANKKLLSISVMAHPSREKFFPYLREKLGDVPFSIDHDSEGVWPNCRKSWLAHDPNAIFHVVIQDDAIICENFRERAEEAIYDAFKRMKAGGEFALNFYFGRRGNLTEMSKAALEKGWTTRVRPTWGVAICLPVHHIMPMIEHADKSNHRADDYRIGMYLTEKGIRTYFPLPSLVDHRSGDETTSLVGDQGVNRVAYKFIDAK